ncbi:transketolase family protein [Candidatus Woesearchaeota archaeon]|nr:transketolase family protein [Candidatus Woesearchaeota archaeon]
MHLNPHMHTEVDYARSGYGDGVVEAGKKNKNVVVLCCDLTDSTKSADFKKQFPQRFVEVGVAEQNMAGIGAGMAVEGKIPFISSYAVFNPGRNWDQIRVSICYTNANVKIIGAHAGISVGPDGATHQALEDIAMMRVLPNMTVLCGADYDQTKKLIIKAAKYKGPVYIRFGREKVPKVTTAKTPCTIGKADVYRQGKDVAVIASGPMVYEALAAAVELQEQKKHKKISCMVINGHTIKPLDKKTIIAAAKKCKAVVTAEEHQWHGGLGGAVAELLASEYPVPVKRVGIQDTFGESGNPDELMVKYKIKKKDIITAVKAVLRMKKK